MIVGVADTHTIIWYIYSDSRLSHPAKNFMDTSINQGNQIAISAITLIEMVYLIEKGRIAAESLSRLARGLSNFNSGLVEIPVNLPVSRMMSQVKVTQIPDMPDRIIAATALYLNVPIISRDSKIQQSGLTTVW